MDMPHTPRYFFGHGLSYTSFAYSDFSCDSEEVRPDEEFRVSVTVKNNGGMAGTEIVQLYLKDVYASMTRPVMELAGFARVWLEPGESKRVTFVTDPRQMAFLDKDLKWKVEAGMVQVMIGASSADIRCTGEIEIVDDMFIAGRERRFYADVM